MHAYLSSMSVWGWVTVVAIAIAVLVAIYSVGNRCGPRRRPLEVIVAGLDLDPDMLREENPVLVYASGMTRVADIAFGEGKWGVYTHETRDAWTPPNVSEWSVVAIPAEGLVVSDGPGEKDGSETSVIEFNGNDADIGEDGYAAYLIVPPSRCWMFTTSARGLVTALPLRRSQSHAGSV